MLPHLLLKLCSLKRVAALTSARRHIPAVHISQLTTEVALRTLAARPREEVTVSGLGLKKNKGKSHLGTEDLGTALAPPGLAQSSTSGPGLQTADAASGPAN